MGADEDALADVAKAQLARQAGGDDSEPVGPFGEGDVLRPA